MGFASINPVMKATSIEITRTDTATADRHQVRQAVRRILDYLTEYPRARDTVRGVAEWWTRASQVATGEALDFLVGRGFLIVSIREGQRLFARNPDFGPAELVRLAADLPTEL